MCVSAHTIPRRYGTRVQLGVRQLTRGAGAQGTG